MDDDGLYEPLGQPGGSNASAGRRWWRHAGALTAAGLVVAVGVLAWWSTHGGPEQVAAVAPLTTPAPKPVVPPAPPPVAAAQPQGPLTGSEVETESGVRVVRPSGASAPPGTFIPVPQADALALPPAPDPRLVEQSRYGILPRQGPDGARPAEVYARPAPIAAAIAGKPRIALFVGGMGLNAALTNAAARELPPAVSLGFAPYGGDLAEQVARVRALGHETLLQVPMESYDTPDGAVMPHMLTTGGKPAETLDSLRWQMSRFVGYAGVSSFLGARFTADAAAFTPVLKDLAARGLFYFDDGTAPRNIAASAGPALGLPVVKADVVIDALADGDAIEAALRKLEKIAKAKGTAVGATTGLPTAVDHVAVFARSLEGRGLALVPVSALADAAPALPARP